MSRQKHVNHSMTLQSCSRGTSGTVLEMSKKVVKEGVLEKVCGDADPQLREFAREEAGEQQDPGAEYLLLPLDQPAHLIHFGRHVCGGRDVSNETSDENARVLGLQIACVLNSPFVRCGRNKGGGLVAGAQRGL